MKAVITVIGKDRTGIIYKVSKVLFDNGMNIEDISQTIMQDYFTMIMLVSSEKAINISQMKEKFAFLREDGISVEMQKTDLFDVMHNI